MYKPYIRINRDTILKASEPPGFDIYVCRKNPHGEIEFVLFAGASMGTKLHEKLKSAPLGALFVREEDSGLYNDFLSHNLRQIIKSEETMFEEKTDIIYNCALDAVKDVFDNPVASENIQRSGEIVQNMVEFSLNESGAIKGLLNLTQKDYYTFTHCVHVSVFCVGLGKVFGIKAKEDLFCLGLGGLFHDIGKSRIDNKILNKPGRLTSMEFEEIKKHPKFGFDMLTGTIPSKSLDVVLHHHEKFNGKGYPEGLQGEQISFFAKISAIADVYDALTTNRCYARARSPFDAIIMMKQDMVGHFEDEKFKAFIQMLGPRMQV